MPLSRLRPVERHALAGVFGIIMMGIVVAVVVAAVAYIKGEKAEGTGDTNSAHIEELIGENRTLIARNAEIIKAAKTAYCRLKYYDLATGVSTLRVRESRRSPEYSPKQARILREALQVVISIPSAHSCIPRQPNRAPRESRRPIERALADLSPVIPGHTVPLTTHPAAKVRKRVVFVPAPRAPRRSKPRPKRSPSVPKGAPAAPQPPAPAAPAPQPSEGDQGTHQHPEHGPHVKTETCTHASPLEACVEGEVGVGHAGAHVQAHGQTKATDGPTVVPSSACCMVQRCEAHCR